MGLIESIGWIAIIFGGLYLLLKNMDNKRVDNKELQKLILHNTKCKNLIFEETKIKYKYNDYGEKIICESAPVFDENGEIINNKIKNKLLAIINDPHERKEALEAIREEQEFEIKRKLELREKRKIGYRFEIEIFEIFENMRDISKIDLLQRIETKFKVDSEKAKELFQIWESNLLIEECGWNKNKMAIGWTLIMHSVIDKNDLTWHKWLKQNGITLEPESKEYLDYMKD